MKSAIVARGGIPYGEGSNIGGGRDLEPESTQSHLRFLSGETSLDFSEMPLRELVEAQRDMHIEMYNEFELAHAELDTILYTSMLIFLLPVAMISKKIFAGLTQQSFLITAANFIDFCSFSLILAVWYFTNLYNTRDLREPFFTPEEDQVKFVKFFGNMTDDIMTDEFRYDYLLAAATAALWIRCLVLLRLTESFGPLLVMIWNMVKIVTQFIILYGIGLITFGAVATLTLTEQPMFSSLFNSVRTYFMASLGSFDLL